MRDTPKIKIFWQLLRIFCLIVTTILLRLLFKTYLSLDVFVLGSLICHFILLGSTSRKKFGRDVGVVVSFLVQLQSAVAGYVMGWFPKYNFSGGRTGELRIFWVPFILLHLGGPNTLTSLTLSDNELWLRFAARFFSLSYSFGLVVYRRSFFHNDLWRPTAFVFLAGALSFFEKGICRFLARLTKFREWTLPKPDPGVNYARLMEMKSFLEEQSVPVGDYAAAGSVGPAGSDNKLSQVRVVKEAYRFFQEFQGLFVNSVFTYNQRDKVRRHFLGIKNAEDAFSICEAELNFAYDVFYTKAILTYRCKYSPLLNLLSLSLQLVSLVFWILIDKHKFQKHSVLATYFLVGGSLAHSLLSLLMYFTSDWFIATVIKHKEALGTTSKLSSLYEYILTDPRLGKLRGKRWSRRIPQLNLLRNVFHNSTRRRCRLSPTAHSTKELTEFIFGELVIRSHYAQHPQDVEDFCSTRGLWVLGQLSRDHGDLDVTLSPWISDVEYEESLILWHLATNLCYYKSDQEDNGQMDDLRMLSKTLSDYMLFLVIYRPEMMPPSEGISCEVIFNDTVAEGKRFCNRVPLQVGSRSSSSPSMFERLQDASAKILDVNTDIISPRKIRGDESEALLFDACELAKKLRGSSNEWRIISKVLAEMLFYSATHSSPSEHLRELNNGGELLTLVWLLMHHLGLGKYFRHKKRKDGTPQIVIKSTNSTAPSIHG